MPTFTIYVTGSNEYFYSVLNGVAMGFNDGDLVWSVVRLGALFAIITGAWHAMQKNLGSGLMRAHSWLENAVALILVTSLAFVPTRVVIQDIYGDQNATPVDNVPLLLAAPATVFSSVGFDAFRYLDTWFQSSTGSAMSVSENGFVTPLKLMLSLRSDMERVAPELYRSWFNYISDCAPNSAVATGVMNQSKDVAQYLWVNGNDNGFVETYIAPSGNQLTTAQLVTCNVAKERLSGRMDRLAVTGSGPNAMSDLDRLINNNMREEKQGLNKRWSYADDFVPAFNTYSLMMGNAAQSAQEYMRNSLMRNVVVDAYRCSTSNMSENDKLLCTQAQHDAIEQFKVDSAGMGTWFTNFMLPLMTMLQLFFFAYSVIALLYAVMRGAGALSFLAKYVLFGAWVFSWLPFVAIINAFIQWMVTDKLGTLSGAALTLENYTTYYEVMSKNLALASTLLASTPLLTLGLMTGSIYAFSGFAQKMSGQDYMQERNLAPNNVDVAPVTRQETQFTHDAFLGQRTNATTLPEVGVGQALQQVSASRREEMVSNQLGTLEKFDRLESAQRQSGGSTTITNADGTKAEATHTAAFDAGMQKIRSLGQQGGYDKADVATAEAQFKAQFGAGFLGGSVGAGLAKSLKSSENRAVSDLISHGIGASAQYAEKVGKQLSSQIAQASTDSNSRTSSAAASFSQQAAISESSARAYSEISSQSSGVRSDQKASVAQIGALIRADEDLGSRGAQVRQQISDQYEKLVASQGPNGRELVDGAVDRKMQQWRSSGAEFQNMGDVARLMVLQDLGQSNAHANIVAGLFSTATPATNSQPYEFAGIGAGAENVSPQGSYNHLNGRVEGAMPGAGGGRAVNRELKDMHQELSTHNPVSTEIRKNSLSGIVKTVNALPEGVFDPNVAPRQVVGKLEAQDRANENLMNPADTREEYERRRAEALIAQKITGVEQPMPIAGQRLQNERREKAEADASAPSETQGNSPQDRDNSLRQRLADARQAIEEDNRDVMEQNRKAAMGAEAARNERIAAERAAAQASRAPATVSGVALPIAFGGVHDGGASGSSLEADRPVNSASPRQTGASAIPEGNEPPTPSKNERIAAEVAVAQANTPIATFSGVALPVAVEGGHEGGGPGSSQTEGRTHSAPSRQTGTSATPEGSDTPAPSKIVSSGASRSGTPALEQATAAERAVEVVGEQQSNVVGDRQMGGAYASDKRAPQREQAVDDESSRQLGGALVRPSVTDGFANADSRDGSNGNAQLTAGPLRLPIGTAGALVSSRADARSVDLPSFDKGADNDNRGQRDTLADNSRPSVTEAVALKRAEGPDQLRPPRGSGEAVLGVEQTRQPADEGSINAPLAGSGVDQPIQSRRGVADATPARTGAHGAESVAGISAPHHVEVDSVPLAGRADSPPGHYHAAVPGREFADRPEVSGGTASMPGSGASGEVVPPASPPARSYPERAMQAGPELAISGRPNADGDKGSSRAGGAIADSAEGEDTSRLERVPTKGVEVPRRQ